MASTGPKIIQVSGTDRLPGPMHEVTSDKTIVGVGANSGFTGGGLNIGLPIDNAITAPPANAVHNVILRNLNFWRAGGRRDQRADVLAPHLDRPQRSVHRGTAALDIKRGSSYVTVSYNHADDTDKNMLLGHDDGNAAQDTGRLKVTYHHNFFDNTDQRNPRVRFGDPVHVYNNYYLKHRQYGVACHQRRASRRGQLLRERRRPVPPGGGSSSGGRLVARNNCLVNSGAGQTGGSVTNPPYAYTSAPPAT